ncbi:MAG: fluoride efflux transporter CrcB [Gammaproteobacteria bacterium]|nr:fluoride efflux transporter CrcB [Gammaproteobacteria bacterium]
MGYLWIALGGALGSVGRFAASGFVARSTGGALPWGTLLVNVTGSLLIGFAAGLWLSDGKLALSADARAFLMIGVLGGFTTFSTFSLETLNLIRAGEWLWAFANVAGSIALCLVAVWLGHMGGAALAR